VKSLAFPVTGVLATILLASLGCSGTGDSTEILDPGGTQMSLVASPATATIGAVTTFTVTARNPQTVLKSVTIDFENDGTWDSVQAFDQTSITATFTHVYTSAGGFIVRAEVLDAHASTTSKTLILLVFAPQIPPIWFRLHGESSAGDQGVCEAIGPPTACDGCLVAIPAAGISTSLGSLPHGSPVSVTQAFDQLRFVTGTTSTSYACGFSLDLYAGTPGSEVQFGHGACTTDSGDIPERLSCSITANGVVP
jgi:hypothetical protein